MWPHVSTNYKVNLKPFEHTKIKIAIPKAKPSSQPVFGKCNNDLCWFQFLLFNPNHIYRPSSYRAVIRSVSVIKTSQLMLYREIMAVCSEIHTKHINTVCGQNVELLNVKLVIRNQWALKASNFALYIF